VYAKGKVSVAGAEGHENDTTFKDRGVEELVAEALNRKLHTTEILNNGDSEDLVDVTVGVPIPL
jgi:hypothetical protein